MNEIIIAGTLILLSFLLGGGIGSSISKDLIAKDCELIEKFRVQERVYECKKIK